MNMKTSKETRARSSVEAAEAASAEEEVAAASPIEEDQGAVVVAMTAEIATEGTTSEEIDEEAAVVTKIVVGTRSVADIRIATMTAEETVAAIVEAAAVASPIEEVAEATLAAVAQPCVCLTT